MAKQGGDQPTSMLQGLQAILGSLGSLMAAPDGDPEFLTQLQHVIVSKIRQSTQQSIQGNKVGPGGGPGGQAGFGGIAQQMQAGGGPGGPGGPPPGMGPEMGMAGGGGPGGPGGPGGMPNPDELRRVLGANAQTG